MKKRYLALLLALLTLATGLGNIIDLSVSAETAQLTFTVDNENTNRGDGELIVYTRSGMRTGTNQWGYEVSVNSEGRVISTGGNNSLVPDGGFVVSGHNSITEGGKQSATFLKNNVKVGDYITYNRKTGIIIVSDKPVFPAYDLVVSYNGENRVRNTNETIIYTSGKTTGTNQWGYEVSVDKNGVVISAGGNNSQIPTGGFVVSGHADAGGYLRDHVLVGMNAALDRTNKTVTFTYTPKTMYLNDLSRLNDLYAAYDENANVSAVMDYKKVSSLLDKAKADLQAAYLALETSGDYMAYYNFSESLSATLDQISATLSESVPVEYRGVWIRPTQTTRQAVADIVQKLYDNGINIISIETLYNGYMIMPMPEGSLFEQNPSWKGFDMLQAFIEEAHKRQMELHLWMPVFYVGHTNSTGHTLYDKKPNWRLQNHNGNTTNDSFLFVNPANEEVQNYLLETYKYIVTNYDVDGLQLDYIRFPGSEWGFNAEIINGFKAKTGITVTGYNPSANWWTAFCEYRASFVTAFVGKVRKMIDDFAPGVILSADVFPDVTTSVTGVMQDYTTWVKNGWLDLVFPMAYGAGSPETYLPKYKQAGINPVIAVGLGPFEPSVDAFVYLHQIRFSRAFGTLGQVAFESNAYLNKGIGDAAVAGPYSVRAKTPSWDKKAALTDYAGFIKKRINETLVYLGYIDKQKANTLSQKIDEAILLFGSQSQKAIENLKKEFEKVENSKAKSALLADAEYLRKINTLPDRKVDNLAGDANGDGKLSVSDYIAVRLHVLGKTPLDEKGLKNADIDSNGKVGIVDYSLIRLKLLG